MSNILHEIQHAVQKREGFTRGTSPASYLPDNHYENLAALQKSSRAEAQDLGKKFNMGPYKVVQAAKAFLRGDTESSSYFDFKEVADADDLKRLSQLVDDEETIMDMQSAIIQANKLYRRQPGEVEARTVQKKFLENRQGEYPLDVQDTPPEEYVFNLESQANLGPQASRLTGLTPGELGERIGGIRINPENEPNRFYFADLGGSEVTLKPSLDMMGEVRPNTIEIDVLMGKPRRQGHGSEILNRINKMADETGTTMRLFPTPIESPGQPTIRLDDLVDFYKSKGFQFEDPDPSITDLDRPMVRYPRKAEGGVMGMVDVARDMTRGPRGVESLVPVARNMNRSMLG